MVNGEWSMVNQYRLVKGVSTLRSFDSAQDAQDKLLNASWPDPSTSRLRRGTRSGLHWRRLQQIPACPVNVFPIFSWLYHRFKVFLPYQFILHRIFYNRADNT